MTITQDEAVQMARECGQNWQYFGYRQTSMVVTLDELTVFANLAYQRGLIEAEAKVKELEALNDFDAKRLRVLTNLLGMSVPESDETLLACAGTVLGTMRRVIENMFKKGNEQEAKIAELQARLEGAAAAYLQIGIGPNEGMVLLAKRIPKNYDKTWWKFEPLFTNPSADAKDAERACKWTPMDADNMPGSFDGECGIAWTFTEGGITENGINFCPKCGRRVVT